VLDPALGLALGGRPRRAVSRVRLVSPARFDDRFDRLFEDSVPGHAIVGVRDARYLTWRYADNPLHDTHALLAEADGRLQGFLLFMVEDGVAQVKDLFPPTRPAELGDLVAALVRHGRRTGLTGLSIGALEGSSLVGVLSRLGFRLRSETSPMFAYAPPDKPWTRLLTEKDNWFMTNGDRDV
jgi:hypothetical protein